MITEANQHHSAYKEHIEAQAQRVQVIKLLKDSMDEVPSLLERAQACENKITDLVRRSRVYPPTISDFITMACRIHGEPSMDERKARVNVMVPQWIELFGNPDLPQHGGLDQEMRRLAGDIADMLMWTFGDAGRYSVDRET